MCVFWQGLGDGFGKLCIGIRKEMAFQIIENDASGIEYVVLGIPDVPEC